MDAQSVVVGMQPVGPQGNDREGKNALFVGFHAAIVLEIGNIRS